jgi:hypothetical protein
MDEKLERCARVKCEHERQDHDGERGDGACWHVRHTEKQRRICRCWAFIQPQVPDQ